MLVYTMSEKEIENEFYEDLENVKRYLEHKKHRFRRKVIKSNKFPVLDIIKYKTPKRNNWIIIFEAKNKNEIVDKAQVSIIVTYNSNKGLYAIAVTMINGLLRLCTYPPHFFQRFRNRTIADKSGIDLIIDYFLTNPNYAVDFGKTDQDNNVDIFSSTESGVSLGCLTPRNNFIFKTFISKSMLKGDQIQKHINNDQIRREMEEAI